MSSFELLRQFATEVGQCTTTAAVASVGIDTMRRVFGTSIAVITLLDAKLHRVETFLDGVKVSHQEDYDQHWRYRDPVLAAVLQRSLPVHHRQVLSLEAWRHQPIFQNYTRQLNVEPYMAAPIYGHGHLAGILSLCRRRHRTEFSDRDLELVTIFSGYLSASLATLPRNVEAEHVPLTIRERQIALLAAQGHDNPAIASELGIARETVKQALRRVYSKLDVSGRAEMAATLVRRGWL